MPASLNRRLWTDWVTAFAAVEAAGLSGIIWAATDHMLRATASLGGACLLGALLRLVLPDRRAGGLVARGRIVDVVLLAAFGMAVLVAGFSLDLRARV